MPRKPRALHRYQRGRIVRLQCYKPTCPEVKTRGVLKSEFPLHSDFIKAGKVGRIKWDPSLPAKSFDLVESVVCPGCQTTYQHATIFSRGRGAHPTIIGYESED